MAKKYIEIKNYLMDQIESGKYIVDKAIPSERDLAELLNANRMTVRKAIEELMYDGLLIRKKGSGTFLTTNKKSKTNLIGEASEKSIKIISSKLQFGGNYGYKVLKIPEGDSYWRLRRVRMLDFVPYAYEDIYFNMKYFSDIDKGLNYKSLTELIKTVRARKEITVYENVEALLCIKNTSILLKVPVGSPILQIKSHFETDGDVIMSCRSYHPGDSYEYESLKRKV